MTRITWQQEGQWQISFADGQTLAGVLCVDSWLHPWLMSLRWRLVTGRRCRVLLWRWQHSPSEWHTWRLRLMQEGRIPAPPDVVPR